VSLERNAAGGSTFTLELPLAVPEQASVRSRDVDVEMRTPSPP